jgi:two-component system sensor histidine kinase RegB
MEFGSGRGSASSPQPLGHLTLRNLLLLRLLAIAGQVAALIVARSFMGVTVPVAPVAGAIAGWLALTAWTSWRLPSMRRISQRTFRFQLLCDVVAFTVVLYFTGGSSNPLAPLFLVPITVAAATLRGASKWLVVGAAVAAYSVLMFLHISVPHLDGSGADFSMHVWGMWCGFVLSAALVGIFVARIGESLREHDQMLAAAREEALRADRVVALGALAAGAAHELGTPLATMAVLSRELEHERHGDAELVARLRLLRSQIDRCKESLARMAGHVAQPDEGAVAGAPADDFLAGLVARWCSSRPVVSVRTRWGGSGPAPWIAADDALAQAIVNVLDNAADASAQAIEVDGSWSPGDLRIEVRDRGLGLAPAVRQRLGEPGVTTKAGERGLGLGFFLARTTVDRLGGRIQLRERVGGGVCAEIFLPLAPLRAAV